MRNRFLSLLLSAAMLLSLAACGTKAGADAPAAPETSQGAAPAPASDPTANPTPEPTADPTTSPTPEPAADPTVNPTPDAEPSGEPPEDTPEPIADAIEVGEELTEIRGGTNQNDALMLPLNTKLYGVVSDGMFSWLAFTTDGNENSEYYIMLCNKTLDTQSVYANVYDEYGTRLSYVGADSNGNVSTLTLSNLSPNTTYYLGMVAYNQSRVTIHYRLTIKSSNAPSAGYSTAGNISEARGAADALEGEIHPGFNLDDAAFIPTNVRLSGTVSDGHFFWFAFTTNEVENPTYFLTLVNETVGSYNVYANIFDEYGTRLSYVGADSNGAASTLTLNNLSPNTTYYFAMVAHNQSRQTIDYTVIIKAPEPPAGASATITPLDEDPLIFETPFELNSTQVMFVANKAVFIDEAAARAALEPVAEAILAHPDHSVLIAGTTATDGTQAACVDLSNRRAEAVKNLLVNAFGVPESQLQTIGLGYEADPFVRGQDRDANGRFIETEGAKNRRVVILDVNDPIAQELLNP